MVIRASQALNRGPIIRAFFAVCVACGTLVLLAAPAQASQASTTSTTPCWKLLLNEWEGGAITTTFAIPCYHEAINQLPADVRDYSNARADIEAALEQAIALKEHRPITATIAGTTTTFQPVAPKPPKSKKSSTIFTKLTPGGAGSFPLPLLILGLLAILLVLAGLGGLGWRRFQARRGSP